MSEPYRPTLLDIVWMINQLQTVKEGGLLLVHGAALVYTVSHLHGTLMLENPEMLAFDTSKLTHERMILVVNWLDYKVTMRQ